MDLYVTVAILSGGSSHRICITDKYYEYLISKNIPYRTKINNELVEIPISSFRKEEDNDTK